MSHVFGILFHRNGGIMFNMFYEAPELDIVIFQPENAVTLMSAVDSNAGNAGKDNEFEVGGWN